MSTNVLELTKNLQPLKNTSVDSDYSDFDFYYGIPLSNLPEKEKKEIEKEVPDPKSLVKEPQELKWQTESSEPTPFARSIPVIGGLAGLALPIIGGAAIVNQYPKSDTVAAAVGGSLPIVSFLGFLIGRDIGRAIVRFQTKNPSKKVQIGTDKNGNPVIVEIREGESIFKRMRQFID